MIVLLVFFTCIGIDSGNKVKALTIENASIEVADRINDNSLFAEVEAPDPLYVGSETVELYVQFEDEDAALNRFILENQELLSRIASEIGVETMNKENVELFYYSGLNSETISEGEMSGFAAFFDIYENTEINQDIQTKVETINRKHLTKRSQLNREIEDPFKDGEMVELALMVPSYTQLAVNAEDRMEELREVQINLAQEQTGITTFGLSGTALTKAINYASKHATSYNTDYQIYSADCTNFASQILETSGVSQVVYTSEHSGWWHKRHEVVFQDPNTGQKWYRHTQSVSWINANTFARYMGVGTRTYNIAQLGNAVVKGDFIAADWSGDGSWDHISFVTAVDAVAGTYNDGKGKYYTYKDFKVAQHSGNYHLWVSNTGSNYETFSSGQVVAIVRR